MRPLSTYVASQFFTRLVAPFAILGALVLLGGCSSDEIDSTPPSVMAVSSTDVSYLVVIFDEPVTRESAEKNSNYVVAVQGASPVSGENRELGASAAAELIVISSQLSSDGRSVLLHTNPPMASTESYEVRVSGVQDLAGNTIQTVTRAIIMDLSCPDTPGTICTWAGTGKEAFNGDGLPLRDTHFHWVSDLTFTSTGIYILDWNNHMVRRVTPENTLETVIGTGYVGDGDPDQADRNPPGVPGTTIDLNHPTQVVEKPDGKIILVAWHNHKLRELDPATGLCFVSCGAGAGFAGDGGPARPALLNQPTQLVIADDGAYYIIDQRNQRIRMIKDDIITTVVGTGVAGFAGDGGPPLEARLRMPSGSNPPPGGAVTLDSQGRLYISDSLNHRIRRVDFGLNIIETIAGDGNPTYGGDGGVATAASLNNPRDLEFGPDGRLYVCDQNNHRVRAIDLDTNIITTIAGNGIQGFGGDGGPATEAMLNRPGGLTFGPDGNLYIADSYNSRIRRVIMAP